MITRIEVDGFKSFRDFAVDLEPFTVLIGPNSAGKSNVLDAIGLLSRLASMPIADAFKHGRGKSIDQFKRRGGEVAGAIRFGVEFLEYGLYPPPAPANGADAFQSRFRYELTIERQALRSGAEKLVATRESFRAIRREEDTWIPSHPQLAACAGYVAGGEDCFARAPPEQAMAPFPWLMESSSTHTRLGRHPFKDDLAGAASLVVRELKRYRVLDTVSFHLGGPSERIDTGMLSPDASNLPTILADVPPPMLGEIRADLVSLVPGIASFATVPEGDEIHLEFELSGGDRLPARLVSAGTLHVLALLTALRTYPRPPLLCIEEPENGIYPARLRALLDLLRDATTRTHEDQARDVFESAREQIGNVTGYWGQQLPTQILLTTHSPVALAALRTRPEHLRFVDMVRRNGERVTRVRTVGKSSRTALSPREIDTILESVIVESEEPA
jgi:predicted ATPase